VLAINLHLDIGMIDANNEGDVAHRGALAHLQQAVELARKQDPSSPVLAIALIDYGQVQSEDSVDVALRTLGEARSLFEANHDNRVRAADAAMAIIANNADRFETARAAAESVLAQPDVNDLPAQTATVKWILARALPETHGDRVRAHQLALEAKAAFEQLGHGYDDNLKAIVEWLPKHK
jgi:hypothetical protein